MIVNRQLLVFLAYLAAVFFFACAVFGLDLHTPLVDDGLLCAAIGFALSAVPSP